MLVDGEQILVGVTAARGVAAATSGTTSPVATLVNLNTADQVALESLPDVGPVTAQAILAWRTENGAFTAVDQLLDVDGIGEATLAKLTPVRHAVSDRGRRARPRPADAAARAGGLGGRAGRLVPWRAGWCVAAGWSRCGLSCWPPAAGRGRRASRPDRRWRWSWSRAASAGWRWLRREHAVRDGPVARLAATSARSSTLTGPVTADPRRVAGPVR